VTGFDLVAALAVGYLLGAVPTAELAARLRGRSIFAVGSGNMGAMNTARNLGVGLGLAVLAVDIGKGALAAALGLAMGAIVGAPAAAPDGAPGGVAVALGSAAGLAAVAGHAWSPYVGLRGGKGLATVFGMTLPLFPWGGIAALLAIVGLLLVFRRQEPATYLTLLAFPLLSYLATMRATLDQELAFAAATAALAASLLVALKHLQLALAARAARGR
jgi:acyl phosphate:glycerol-3-phosphate acyltransferase